MHFISLTAPKHPKNANKQTKAEVMTSTYTAPEKRFVPNSSLRKLRSMSVIKPITNTIAPPSCNAKIINGLEPVFIAVVEWIIFPFFFCIAVVMKRKTQTRWKGSKNYKILEILTNMIKFDTNIPYLTTCEQQLSFPETPMVFLLKKSVERETMSK